MAGCMELIPCLCVYLLCAFEYNWQLWAGDCLCLCSLAYASYLACCYLQVKVCNLQHKLKMKITKFGISENGCTVLFRNSWLYWHLMWKRRNAGVFWAPFIVSMWAHTMAAASSPFLVCKLEMKPSLGYIVSTEVLRQVVWSLCVMDHRVNFIRFQNFCGLFFMYLNWLNCLAQLMAESTLFTNLLLS